MDDLPDAPSAPTGALPGDDGRIDAVPGCERRLVLRILEHWRAARGARRAPTLDDLALDHAPELWENAFLLAVREDGGMVFTAVGEVFQSYSPVRLVGVALAELPPDSLVAHFASFAGEVLARVVPITCGGQIPATGEPVVLYRSIVLPVADADGRISALLGAANWREVVSR